MDKISASVTTWSVDLAKHVFQVAGENARGEVVFEHRYRSREAFVGFVRALALGQQVLMETGPGAQAWAREMQSRGASVRVLPAQRVAEHRSGAKNDRNDACALLRAGRDAAVHAVPIKSAERLALQALHRVRCGLVRRRTAVGNQIRGLLLEHGVVIAKGDLALSRRLSGLLADASVPLPDRLRDLVAELWGEWEAVGARIVRQAAQLEELARADPLARRLMTIPGVGPITASALICKDLTMERFASARQFAAYFGVVPDQRSSGNRVRLGRMSRRGDGYLRSLTIQGAHAVLQQLRPDAHDPASERLRRWQQRHGRAGAAVRLANRNLRIVWSLLRHDTSYRRPEAIMT